jgi:iron complex outermembrane receptor protein
VSDLFNITDNLSAMASVRVDHFEGRSNTYSEENGGQTAFSPKFGLVYQPLKDKVSLFANYMNGFMNVAPVTYNNGTSNVVATFDPEHANQFEVGVKTNLFKERLSVTASYYNIQVKDRVAFDGVNAPVQGGEVESKGVEISVIANPVTGMNIVGGISHNESEVTKEALLDEGYLGMRPEDAGPETIVNLWASYTIPRGKLEGFGLGIGGNYASEYLTLNRSNIGTFALPDYTILNTALSYTGPKFGVTLKLNNALNEKYYGGWSTVTPQRLRSVVAGLTYKF